MTGFSADFGGRLFSKHQPGGVFSVLDPANFPGKVLFVDSTNGADSAGRGQKPSAPLATIDFAIGLCTANEGNVIFVAPGHTETLATAAALDLDVAGVTVIGLGKGTLRPTITMSAVGSTVHMDAANCHIENILFPITADVTKIIDIDKTDCTVKNCEFRGDSSKQFVTAIDVDGGSANACDRTQIIGCKFDSDAVGSTDAIKLAEVADGVLIDGCTAVGNYSVSPIHNPIGSVLTDLIVRDCFLKNDTTGQTSLELVSASTGFLIRNFYHNDLTQATGQDTGACRSFECYHCDVIDKSGIISPAIT